MASRVSLNARPYPDAHIFFFFFFFFLRQSVGTLCGALGRFDLTLYTQVCNSYTGKNVYVLRRSGRVRVPCWAMGLPYPLSFHPQQNIFRVLVLPPKICIAEIFSFSNTHSNDVPGPGPRRAGLRASEAAAGRAPPRLHRVGASLQAAASHRTGPAEVSLLGFKHCFPEAEAVWSPPSAQSQVQDGVGLGPGRSGRRASSASSGRWERLGHVLGHGEEAGRAAQGRGHDLGQAEEEASTTAAPPNGLGQKQESQPEQ